MVPRAGDRGVSDLEAAYGNMFGLDGPPKASQAAAAAAAAGGLNARQAMTEVLLRALERPPCVVSFSGGRDSSSLLAAATEMARRHGLELPIPATLVFPNDEGSAELEWQTLVLEHLRLPHHERIIIEGDRLDAVGPVATDLLRRHGLLWPFNTHFHQPIVEFAAGGTVVTGFGGDELAKSSRNRRAAHLIRQRGPIGLSSALMVGFAFSPARLRAAVVERRFLREANELPWLTPEAIRLASRAYARDEAREPWRWDRMLQLQFRRSRYFTLAKTAFTLMGSTYDTRVIHPFLEPAVLAGLGRDFTVAGPLTRSEIMRHLVGEILPSELFERQTKATFTNPLWTGTAKRFAREHFADAAANPHVDPEGIRKVWSNPAPAARTTMLLQQTWLRVNGLPTT